MKVSINWLKSLVELNRPLTELVELINLRTIGTKEVADRFIELDMKGYNRADLLSLRGVAYELAAILGSAVKFDELPASEYTWVNKSLPETLIEIEDKELASIQCVAKIEGLKVGRSEKEWLEKLEDSGMRPVNNIVDATNLVMLEYGHPLHSFDAKTVKDDTIIVRRARKDEKITTLDGKKRVLDQNDLVLADRKKALDVAGVMGGKDTEISDSTDTILLSASLFNPKMVRKTGQKLGLHSEASKRFYHGLTRKRLLQAMDAAIKMYQKLGGKLTSFTLKGDLEDQSLKIPLTITKTNSLIGVDFKESQIEVYLKRLNFEFKKVDGSSWVVTPPYYRLDVSIEEDVIEEVARMYGYENIRSKVLPGQPPQKIDQKLFELIFKLKQNLAKEGLSEVQTYSFYSTSVLEALGFNETNKQILIKVTNPISSETEYLRMNIWPNLVEIIDKNIRQGFKDIAVFEVGKEFVQAKEGEAPLENNTLALALFNKTDNPISELNQIFKKLIKEVGLNLEAKEDSPPQVLKHLFHPKRFLSVYRDGQRVGGMAEVHKRITDKFGIDQRVAILQINITSLV